MVDWHFEMLLLDPSLELGDIKRSVQKEFLAVMTISK